MKSGRRDRGVSAAFHSHSVLIRSHEVPIRSREVVPSWLPASRGRPVQTMLPTEAAEFWLRGGDIVGRRFRRCPKRFRRCRRILRRFPYGFLGLGRGRFTRFLRRFRHFCGSESWRCRRRSWRS